MKYKNLIFCLFLVILVFLILGCSDSEEQTGILKISFDSGVSRTLVPDISMEVKSYEISGEGPGGNEFSTLESKGEEVIIPNLYKGNWTITVLGLNSDGIAIGEGSASVTIIPNKTVSTKIEVLEYSGEGSLSFEITWPSSVSIENPQIEAILTPMSGDSNTTISFTNKENFSATYLGNLDVGSYQLSLSFFDGDEKLYGTTLALRIVKDKTTEGKIELTKENLNLNGNLSLSVEDGLPDPFNLSVIQSTEIMLPDDTVKFTAKPDEEGSFAYSWFIDGEKQEETSEEFFISEDLSLGNHTIDLIASHKGFLASVSTMLLFKEVPDNYVKIKIKDSDTDETNYEFLLEYGLNNLSEILNNETSEAKLGPICANEVNYWDNSLTFLFIAHNINSVGELDIEENPKNATSLRMEVPIVEGEVGSTSDGNIWFLSERNGMEYDGIIFDGHCGDIEFEVINFGEVGEKMEATVIFSDMIVYYGNTGDEYPDLENGSFTVEIELKVTRGEDIIVY
ncbi:MAG: hypothetical protein PHD05_02335 [Sphaerochaetaceae bacterium]|nr:hypothetical protein [Sphaerochaetaceae bacterium]